MMESFQVGGLKGFRFQSESGSPKARVLLLHGMGEHCGRHQNTITHLTQHDFEVVTFDFRGTGQSAGERMWIEHFEDYVDDAAQVQRWINEKLPPLPLFILGHSLGGAIALYFAAKPPAPIKGLILSAPAFREGNALSPTKKRIAKYLSRFIPHFVVHNAIDLDSISRDPIVVETFRHDKLCCFFNTLRQGSEIIRAMEGVPEKASQIQVPTLIVHGAEDQLVIPEGSEQIFSSLSGTTDKTLKLFEGGFHELHNDLDKEAYFSLLTDWLSRHLS